MNPGQSHVVPKTLRTLTPTLSLSTGRGGKRSDAIAMCMNQCLSAHIWKSRRSDLSWLPHSWVETIMVLQILRALFVLLMAAVGYYFLKEQDGATIYQIPAWLMLMITLAIGVLVVCVDILSPRRKLAIFSGTFLGLIVGMLISYGFSFIVALLVDRYMPDATDPQRAAIIKYL